MVPERWYAILIGLPSEGDTDLLSEGLLRLGGRAVEVRDDGLVTYLPPPPDPERFLTEALEELKELSGATCLDAHWWWQEQEDWEEVWKRGLVPRRVTDRIVVAPTWEEVEERGGDVVVTLDPGMAFGTAEHATTRGCLRLLDRVVADGDRIVDVGCGSGILSIAAAKLGAAEVLALEMDPLACHAAVENAEVNGVAGRVRVEERLVDGEYLAQLGPFDGIVANIESGVVGPLLTAFRAVVEDEGWVIVGGILLSERDDIAEAASDAGLPVAEEDVEGEWWSALLRPWRAP